MDQIVGVWRSMRLIVNENETMKMRQNTFFLRLNPVINLLENINNPAK